MSGWRGRLEVRRRLVLNDYYLRHRFLAAGLCEMLKAGQSSVVSGQSLLCLPFDLQISKKARE
jgi:hypothetical protein